MKAIQKLIFKLEMAKIHALETFKFLNIKTSILLANKKDIF